MEGSGEGGKIRIYTHGRAFSKRGREMDYIYSTYTSL